MLLGLGIACPSWHPGTVNGSMFTVVLLGNWWAEAEELCQEYVIILLALDTKVDCFRSNSFHVCGFQQQAEENPHHEFQGVQ